MNVKVVFFASLRDVVGVSEMQTQARDLPALMKVLKEKLSTEAYEALVAENVRVAVNQTLLAETLDFAENDEVAFLPPVTGG